MGRGGVSEERRTCAHMRDMVSTGVKTKWRGTPKLY